MLEGRMLRFSCNTDFLFYFVFRLPWLHQWIFSQLHGVFSLCCKLVQLTYYHIIPVTLNKEAYVFWHVLLALRAFY